MANKDMQPPDSSLFYFILSYFILFYNSIILHLCTTVHPQHTAYTDKRKRTHTIRYPLWLYFFTHMSLRAKQPIRTKIGRSLWGQPMDDLLHLVQMNANNTNHHNISDCRYATLEQCSSLTNFKIFNLNVRSLPASIQNIRLLAELDIKQDILCLTDIWQAKNMNIDIINYKSPIINSRKLKKGGA